MLVRVLTVVVFLRNAVVACVRHHGTTLAAALAFYISLAFAPTVVLSL